MELLKENVSKCIQMHFLLIGKNVKIFEPFDVVETILIWSPIEGIGIVGRPSKMCLRNEFFCLNGNFFWLQKRLIFEIVFLCLRNSYRTRGNFRDDFFLKFFFLVSEVLHTNHCTSSLFIPICFKGVFFIPSAAIDCFKHVLLL